MSDPTNFCTGEGQRHPHFAVEPVESYFKSTCEFGTVSEMVLRRTGDWIIDIDDIDLEVETVEEGGSDAVHQQTGTGVITLPSPEAWEEACLAKKHISEIVKFEFRQ